MTHTFCLISCYNRRWSHQSISSKAICFTSCKDCHKEATSRPNEATRPPRPVSTNLLVNHLLLHMRMENLKNWYVLCVIPPSDSPLLHGGFQNSQDVLGTRETCVSKSPVQMQMRSIICFYKEIVLLSCIFVLFALLFFPFVSMFVACEVVCFDPALYKRTPWQVVSKRHFCIKLYFLNAQLMSLLNGTL